MRANAVDLLRRHRVPILFSLDASAWFAALFIAVALRLETTDVSLTLHTWNVSYGVPIYGVLLVAAVAALFHGLAGWVLRLHQGRAAMGSFEEVFLLASVLLASAMIAAAVNLSGSPVFVPRSTPAIAAFIALVFCVWPRALWRVVVHQSWPGHGAASSAVPVLIAGAGEGGRQLVQSMQRDREQNWRPVGFLDDDPRKRHFRFRGLSVLGTIDDLARAARLAGADAVVIAIPSATSVLISRVNELALDVGLDVKVLPGVNEVLGGVQHTAVRDLAPEDLLGRHQIETDVESIAHYLAGKRVLVTGAGGSIGSELCRQIVRFGPAELIKLDRDESALHSLLLSIYGRADLEARNVVLADIRDPARILEVFREHQPDVVFHAAALKHVNMLENHPGEALKTNVVGTLNVLQAAEAVGVEKFVNISTDKAADPVNVLGYTKRLAEALTAGFADRTDGAFISVRFGNVLGTRGSVLRTFAAQVKAGGPVTVTDPDVTRYFMTIDEAVQLVIQAAAIGRDGEALVLDMGDPVRIADVASQIIDQSRKDIDVVFTGLKPGEKLHEVLFSSHETDERPFHPLVSHVAVPPLSPDVIDSLALRDPQELPGCIAEVCDSLAFDVVSPSRGEPR